MKAVAFLETHPIDIGEDYWRCKNPFCQRMITKTEWESVVMNFPCPTEGCNQTLMDYAYIQTKKREDEDREP